jgi:hypothetical protein
LHPLAPAPDRRYARSYASFAGTTSGYVMIIL